MNRTTSKKIEDYTAHELYIAAKKQLAAEYTGLKFNNYDLDLLFNECERRNPEIYKAALEDSLAGLIEQGIINKGNTRAIARSEFMSDVELYAVQKKFSLVKNDDSSLNFADLLFCTVEGDSMINAGIYNGDELAVKKTKESASGDIVVARVNGNVFVKRIKFANGAVTLCSANENFPDYPIQPGDEFEIIGVVIRKLQKI